MASSLATLPGELHLHVLQYLGNHDLLRVMLCSRHFYDLALPVLYETLTLPDFNKPRIYEIGWMEVQHCQDVADLVHTLAQNSFLASCARTLRVFSWDVTWNEQKAWSTLEDGIQATSADDSWLHGNPPKGDEFAHIIADPKRYDFELLHERVKLASRSGIEERMWMRELRMFNEDAWIGLLVTLLPKLKRLEMELPFGTLYLPSLFARAGSQRQQQPTQIPVLVSLSEVCLSGSEWTNFSGIPLRWALPFFNIPTMRRFSALRLLDEDDQVVSDVSSSPITHIEICAGESRRGISELVKSCERLESFKFSQKSDNEYKYNPMAIYSALSHHARDTLETFWLEDHVDDNPGPWGDPGRFPSFQRFTALKILHVRAHDWPWPDLVWPEPWAFRPPVFSNMFPSSLERLHFAHVIEPMFVALVPGLEAYISSHLDQTPRLREVAFVGSASFTSVRELTVGIKDAWAKVGIEFQVYFDEGKELQLRSGFVEPPFNTKGY